MILVLGAGRGNGRQRPVGEWAAAVLADRELAAPHLMPIEAANILHRVALAGDITTDAASLAHDDLLELRVELCHTRRWPNAVGSLRTT